MRQMAVHLSQGVTRHTTPATDHPVAGVFLCLRSSHALTSLCHGDTLHPQREPNPGGIMADGKVTYFLRFEAPWKQGQKLEWKVMRRGPRGGERKIVAYDSEYVAREMVRDLQSYAERETS